MRIILSNRKSSWKSQLSSYLNFVAPFHDFHRITHWLQPTARLGSQFWFIGSIAAISLLMAGFLIGNWSSWWTVIQSTLAFNSSALFDWIRFDLMIVSAFALNNVIKGVFLLYYGQSKPQANLWWLCVHPIFQIDWSGIRHIESRFGRFWTQLSGSVGLLVMGAAGAGIWILAPEHSVWASSGALLALAGYGVSLVILLNPCLPYDGYHALEDFSGMAALRHHADNFTRYWVKTRLFRMDRDAQLEAIPMVTSRLFLGYGLLMFINDAVLLVIGFFILLKKLLFGFIGLLGVLVWLYLGYRLLGQSLRRAWHWLRDYILHDAHRLVFYVRYVTMLIGLVLAAGFAASLVIKLPPTMEVSCAVSGVDMEIVKAPAEGKVISVSEDSQRRLIITIEAVNVLGTENIRVQSQTSGLTDFPTRNILNRYVIRNDAIITIYHPEKMRGVMDVPVSYLLKLTPGTPVKFYPDSASGFAPVNGTIGEVMANAIGSNQESVMVNVSLDNRQQSLRQGMIGKACIYLPRVPFWMWVKSRFISL